MTERAILFEVFGKVQGVFFRKYTQAKARELDLAGWCLNTDRKSVQGAACGGADGADDAPTLPPTTPFLARTYSA